MKISTDRNFSLDAIQFVEDPDGSIAEWTLDELDHDFGPVGAPWMKAHASDA